MCFDAMDPCLVWITEAAVKKGYNKLIHAVGQGACVL